MKENLLKSASEIEEYKSLLDRIEEINTVIEVIEYIQNYETCLNGEWSTGFFHSKKPS